MEFQEKELVPISNYFNDKYLEKVNPCSHLAVLIPTIYNIDGVSRRVNLHFKVTFTHKHDKVTVAEIEVEKDVIVRMSAIINEDKEQMLFTQVFERMILEMQPYFREILPESTIQISPPLIPAGEVRSAAEQTFLELKALCQM